MDWLWPGTSVDATLPLTATAAFMDTTLPRTDTGTLRLEAPEFIPHNQSLESQDDPPTSLTAEDTDTSQLPIELEE